MAKDLLDRVICVDPWFVAPPHRITDETHFRTIAASMRVNGWLGRPLIVIPLDRKHYQATTGSHRHAASLEASLPKIPVLPLNREELSILKRGLGYDIKGHQLWDYMEGSQILIRAGHKGIADLLRMDLVTSLMELEISDVKPWEAQAKVYYENAGYGDPEAMKVMAVEKWGCR